MKNPNTNNYEKRNIKQKVIRGAAAVVAAAAISGVAEGSASGSPVSSVKSAHEVVVNPHKKISASKTAFSALTHVISNLEHGKQARVTEEKIQIPGPIGEAEGQPLVFKANKQTYFAYTQITKPNFDQKRPADVAGDMVIMKEPEGDVGTIHTEDAYIDKTGTLIDANEIPVGFSTGGDSGK